MAKSKEEKELEKEAQAAKRANQYREWGVVVQTSQIRGAHIANGLVQLLRAQPAPPPWTRGAIDPSKYVKLVVEELERKLPDAGWKLSDAARAFCVTGSKEGPLDLAAEAPSGDVQRAGWAHAQAHLAVSGAAGLPRLAHDIIAGALNADERVYLKGGDDPTTATLRFAGYSSVHTLAGMHAATFLGLLSATPSGCAAAARISKLLSDDSDPHTQLIRRLGLATPALAVDGGAWSAAFPVPSGTQWDRRAADAATLASNLLAWIPTDRAKAEVIMAFVDLAMLLQFLALLQWSPADALRPLLLMVAPLRRPEGETVERAKRNMEVTFAALRENAKAAGKQLEDYYPDVHAKHLGTAAGWLWPRTLRGGARHLLCPGPRQLSTLTHALLRPNEELGWEEFAARAEELLGVIIGGAKTTWTGKVLGLNGAGDFSREAARHNRASLVALGLARQESDNVVIVDGGAR